MLGRDTIHYGHRHSLVPSSQVEHVGLGAFQVIVVVEIFPLLPPPLDTGGTVRRTRHRQHGGAVPQADVELTGGLLPERRRGSHLFTL